MADQNRRNSSLMAKVLDPETFQQGHSVMSSSKSTVTSTLTVTGDATE